jgi:hypothetical protein
MDLNVTAALHPPTPAGNASANQCVCVDILIRPASKKGPGSRIRGQGSFGEDTPTADRRTRITPFARPAKPMVLFVCGKNMQRKCLFFVGRIKQTNWSAIYRKRIKADVVARPAGTLEARTFLAATRAACTSAQLVAGSIWPPQDDSDRASKGSVVLAVLTPQPYPGRRPL